MVHKQLAWEANVARIKALDNPLHVQFFKDLDVSTWPTGPPPATGQFQRYPGRFLYHLTRSRYFEGKPSIMEMFCGQSQLRNMGYEVFTTDIREETGADLVCPYNEMPDNLAGTFDIVLADPPYNVGFANQWITHKKDLPIPKHILREGAKMVKPGGLIIILHIINIPAYKIYNVKRIAVHRLLCGPNNSNRTLNILREK